MSPANFPQSHNIPNLPILQNIEQGSENHVQRDPDRSAAARQRFDEAAHAVSSALGGRDYLVGERFTVADVLVGSTLAFTERIGFADELPVDLRDYMARLTQRPARQRALERTMSG